MYLNLISRPLYLNRLQQMRDFDAVKILLGMRGVGKTSLLDLFFQQLILSGVKRENIFRIDFDSLAFMKLEDEEDFYNLLALQMSDDAKNFLLLDEVQRIKNWQVAVNRLKKNFYTDIYITTSTDFDEKFFDSPPIILNILPLSFKEFQTFGNFPDEITLKDKWRIYLQCGGFPAVVKAFPNQSEMSAALSNIFSAAVVRDILGAESKISDFYLLNELAKKISADCAEVNSFNSISNLFEGKKPAPRTVGNYLEQLCRAKIFYSVPIFDPVEKVLLNRYAKYYPADIGLKNFMSGETPMSQKILETVILHELMRLDVKISIYRVEKNFIFQVEREELGDKIYISPVKNLRTEAEKNSAYKTFRAVKNFFSKWIITAEENISDSPDGIKVTNILDFLMSE